MPIPADVPFHHIWARHCISCETMTKHVYRRVTPDEPTKETLCCTLCGWSKAEPKYQSIVIFLPLDTTATTTYSTGHETES